MYLDHSAPILRIEKKARQRESLVSRYIHWKRIQHSAMVDIEQTRKVSFCVPSLIPNDIHVVHHFRKPLHAKADPIDDSAVVASAIERAEWRRQMIVDDAFFGIVLAVPKQLKQVCPDNKGM